MSIPEFPEFVPVDLEHKPEVDVAFAHAEPVISEFTFTNLFMWRFAHNISVSKMREHILFLAQPSGKQPFFFPPWGRGDTGLVVMNCLQYLAEKWGGGYIERMPEHYVEEHIQPLKGMDIIPDPANDDYVYASQDLSELSGRRYDGKRNAIRKFLKAHSFEYRTIDRELVRLCLELQCYWCMEKRCELYPGLMKEERAARLAFSNYEALGIRGGAIIVDGRVAAFSLGEKLNEDTLVVHVEKADPTIRGAYAVINQQFAQHESLGYNYINREQDLGDAGLRKAKLSYHPALMVHKFKVGLKT